MLRIVAVGNGGSLRADEAGGADDLGGGVLNSG
jgi:hypothetical protein